MRRLILVLIAFALCYVGSFVLDSCSGGYWDQPERDGRDRLAVGLSLSTAILWQPRFGYWARYNSDWLGSFYSPLIQLDRRWVHPTRYVSDSNFWDWFKTTMSADWHPRSAPKLKQR